MTITQPVESTPRRPLRLWPGVVIVILQFLLRFGVPLVQPEAILVPMIGAVAGGLAIVVWWLFFSRAPWSERTAALVLMIIAPIGTKLIVHESIAGAGMGILMFIMAIPPLCLALVLWAAASRRLAAGPRRVAMVAAILLACGTLALVRTGGIIGGGRSDIHWRWSKTAEERLLAQASDEPVDVSRGVTKAPSPAPAAENPEVRPVAVAKAPDAAAATPPVPAAAKPGPAALAPAETVPVASVAATTRAGWPGFRGPGRDSVIRGVRIETDWSKSPPVQMWRRPIGPGWSSFAIRGDLLYTQEQRGADEIVASYKLSTGEPVWKHRDGVRFYESNGGAGPRATPTLNNDRLYAFGATGILNALDAGTGKVVWSRNAAADTGSKIPDWGFASSPLVADDLVIVAVSGTLAAYDLATGKPRWVGPSHGGSYSSPHRATIDGVAQIVLLNGDGAISVAPANGTVLWEHTWPGSAIVQPALTADGDLLINSIGMSGGVGIRRIAVAHASGEWTVAERWTSNGLKPYFNDYVVHKGHAFGFDGSILACIDLADGKRTWKGGRYGNGQLVLLPDQDLLLVLSEDGELVLVRAAPDQFTELARFQALEGKTWNHPVLIGDILLVRNGEEMAAFRLSLSDR